MDNAKTYSKDLPIAINGNKLRTFSNQIDRQHATQIVGRDHYTGKLVWKFSLYDDKFIDSFRTIVAIKESLFVLDHLPRWQLWLLKRNFGWALNQGRE